ncbi:uncharacterized protein [Maniola hyperantus]|uniref:uncharacterized protein n=1 Tax=Aphantopus hyperantus TaxID=2795564 RepID=UPI002138A974
MADLKQREMADLKQDAELTESDIAYHKCCGCIPLREGCLILGYVNLVSSVIFGINCVTGIIEMVGLLHGAFGELDAGDEGTVVTNITTYSVFLIWQMIALAFAILLLVGLHTERPKYVKIFLVFAVIDVVLEGLVMIFRSVAGYAPIKTTFFSLLMMLLFVAYFLLVLWSQYVKMKIAAKNRSTQHDREGQLMNSNQY